MITLRGDDKDRWQLEIISIKQQHHRKNIIIIAQLVDK